MNQRISLAHIKPGETVRIEQVFGEDHLRRRLRDMGLIEGTRVVCLGKSPAGDPAAYLVRGAVIAIRKRDADNIKVCTAEERRTSWD